MRALSSRPFWSFDGRPGEPVVFIRSVQVHDPCPTGQRGDGRYSAQAAAALLNVTVYTIADWCKSGKLDGVQMAPRGPWWVVLTSEIITALRKPVRQSKPRRATNGPGSNLGAATRRSPKGSRCLQRGAAGSADARRPPAA